MLAEKPGRDGICMSAFKLLLVILPLGLDTLGVSLSLGMKSFPGAASGEKEKQPIFPYWLRSAILFSLAEMLMPVVGLVIGYAVSLLVSNVMHYVGSVLLIGVGAWASCTQSAQPNFIELATRTS